MALSIRFIQSAARDALSSPPPPPPAGGEELLSLRSLPPTQLSEGHLFFSNLEVLTLRFVILQFKDYRILSRDARVFTITRTYLRQFRCFINLTSLTQGNEENTTR